MKETPPIAAAHVFLKIIFESLEERLLFSVNTKQVYALETTSPGHSSEMPCRESLLPNPHLRRSLQRHHPVPRATKTPHLLDARSSRLWLACGVYPKRLHSASLCLLSSDYTSSSSWSSYFLLSGTALTRESTQRAYPIRRCSSTKISPQSPLVPSPPYIFFCAPPPCQLQPASRGPSPTPESIAPV